MGTGSPVTEMRNTYSRRQFVIYQSMIDAGTTEEQATEKVASAAREHPEWDLDEQLTWAAWDEQQPRGRRVTDPPQASSK